MRDADMGDMLNRVAWLHRAEAFGLSRKTRGHFCPSRVGQIACDILQRGAHLWDVLGAADDGDAAFVVCGQSLASVPDFNERPWIAPVAPGDAPTPNPEPQPDPTAPLKARIAALERDVALLTIAEAEALRARDEARATAAAHTAELAVRTAQLQQALTELAKPVQCLVRPGWTTRLGVRCEAVR